MLITIATLDPVGVRQVRLTYSGSRDTEENSAKDIYLVELKISCAGLEGPDRDSQDVRSVQTVEYLGRIPLGCGSQRL